jgi:hypothetical protein
LSNIYKKLQVNSRTEAVLRLGKSTGQDSSSAPGKSTVEIKGEPAENGMKPIFTRRLSMNRMFYWIGGSFLAIALVVGILLAAARAPGKSGQADIPAPSAKTIEANMPLPVEAPLTIAEVNQMAGFDVVEPGYLPAGVFFDHAVFQGSPNPQVTLYYKLIHETLGDRGVFFQISQERQTSGSPNPTECGVTGGDCQLIPLGNGMAYYRLSAPTESVSWEMNGFSFSLLRTAGEPNKIYKDELLKVVESMMPLSANPVVAARAPEIALTVLGESFTNDRPLKVIQEGEMSYAEFGKTMRETIDRPADLRVWVAVYFNEVWQYRAFPATLTPVPPFRGCVTVIINLVDGSPIAARGPLGKGILPGCDQ